MKEGLVGSVCGKRWCLVVKVVSLNKSHFPAYVSDSLCPIRCGSFFEKGKERTEMDRRNKEILVRDSRSGNMTFRLLENRQWPKRRLRWLFATSGSLKRTVTMDN